MKTIVWLREDLRLFDNPALHYAASNGAVLPVYIFPEGLGSASYWWLHKSLEKLSAKFKEHNIDLILRTGEAEQILLDLSKQIKAGEVVWNRVYSPSGIEQGSKVKEALCETKTRSFNGQLLIEPGKIFNKQGTPFKVFTPFWRHCQTVIQTPELFPEPKLQAITEHVESEAIEDWNLLPTKPNWAGGLDMRWEVGEDGAQKRWALFLESTVDNYSEGRNIPSQDNTSYLSPHLAFGEISSRQIWFDAQQAIASNQIDSHNGLKFLSEIGWREFSRYLLIHFPHIVNKPFNQRFDNFPWQEQPQLLKAWQQGQTGYPIVDAGMRELWATGYMHNRVRMVVASFLTKHCLTHWQHGMDWFWDTLVDADIANNTASWQWVSGCGADAAPYFRVFNPILQGEKFDKQGSYIKHWVPELSQLSNKYINKPWEADPFSLQSAGVILGENYPFPIVDHKQARNAALNAYQVIRS